MLLSGSIPHAPHSPHAPHALRADHHTLRCTLLETIDEIPVSDWRAVVDESTDLAMDRRLIAVQQRALRDQCRMWFAVVRDEQRQPCACACLCLFKVDGVISAHPIIQRAAALARKMHRDLLQFGVLFCGLPIPSGASHLRIAPGANVSSVIESLRKCARQLAQQQHASLIVFKEFNDHDRHCTRALEAVGFAAGDVPPMHILHGAFHDFDGFLQSMRARYRAQVQRSRKKIAANGFLIERHCSPQAIDRVFTPEVHALYEHVWQRSEYRLERLPHSFFIEAAHALPDETSLTIIRRSCGQPVGFTFSLARGERWHNLFSGIDYSVNGEGDLLFNLFYADLAAAFDRGCTHIHLGQTADAFKSRLGAHSQPLRFLVRARSSLVHAGLRLMAPTVFPTVAHDVGLPQRVFKPQIEIVD